jgi:hypothetical protein
MIAVLSLATLGRAQAAEIFFDDANRGPAGEMIVGGVQITAFSGTYGMSSPTDASTVGGVGLGADALGPLGWVSRQDHYPAGQQASDSQLSEGLFLTVDGRITSFTVRPECSAVETGQPLNLPFEIRYSGDPGQNFCVLDPSSYSAVTIDLSGYTVNPLHNLFIDITGDFGEAPYFDAYRHANLAPDITIQYGFTLVSLEFTPAPEPTAGAVLGLGLAGIGLARCRRGAGRAS